MLPLDQNVDMRRGVGYIRISDKKQIDGESPETQKRIIEGYAKRENIEIIEWFYDEARSGKNAERKELQNLLKFAVKRTSKIDCVVVFKMNRASRDIACYYTGIKAVLAGKGINILSATEHFDDSPMGRWLEGMLVLNGQLDNEVKSSQVVENMTSLAMQGYWQHKPLLGYERYSIPNELGKLRPSMRPANQASLVKKVLERYSKGDITKANLARYSKDIGLRSFTGKILNEEAIDRILKRPEYAGYVHDKFTNYELVEGRHEGLISKDTYWMNQRVLGNKTKAGEIHTSKNKLYPLKQTVLCHSCSLPLYGSAPKNGSGNYTPMYHCARKQCRGFVRSVNANKIHDKYIELLEHVQPSDELIRLQETIMIRLVKEQNQLLNTKVQNKRAELDDIAKTRLDALEESVGATLDRKQQLQELVDHLDTKKLDRLNDLHELEERQQLQESKLEYMVRFMYNLSKQWNDADFDLKVRFQSMMFPEGLTLNTQTSEFGTVQLSPLFRYIANKKDLSEKEKSLLVTHVDQTWNSVLEGLERINTAVEKLVLEGEE